MLHRTGLRDRRALFVSTTIAALLTCTATLHADDLDLGGDECPDDTGGGGGGGQTVSGLFSVDRLNDQLVRLDPTTGVATSVGGLGLDVNVVDLAWHDGNLYGVDTRPNNTVDLLQIDTNTGAASILATLTSGGSNVTTAEGLASYDGNLLVGFSDRNPITSSNAVGYLSLDGTITGSQDLSNNEGIADVEAFTVNPLTGDWISADVRVGLEVIEFYEIGLDNGGMYNSIGGVGLDEVRRLSDIAFYEDALLGVNPMWDQLHTFDPATGALLNSVDIIGATELYGLSYGEWSTVPAPGALAAFVLAAGRRRRRRS